MSNENLTAEEKRNIEQVKGWADAWAEDAARSDDDNTTARFVDEYYAETADVVSAMVNFYWARQGHDLQPWRTVEIEDRKRLRSGKITFTCIVAQGDTVAVEMEGSFTGLSGRKSGGWGAAFFKFDKDGKMISDRTYNSEPRPSKEDATWQMRSPEQRAAIEKIFEWNG